MITKQLASVIEEVNRRKTNPFTEEQLTEWINKLESTIQIDLLKTPLEELIRYTYETDQLAELIVPEPFTDVYVYYLFAMIDMANNEIASYNNSMAMFENAYSQYLFWFNHNNPTRYIFKNGW